MEDWELVISRAKNAVISRDFDLAVRLYNSLLKEDPSNAMVLEALGSIYIKNGMDEKALPYFEAILEKSPSDFNALNNIGGIYRRLKIYDDAIVVLQKALDLDKNNSEINYNLGFTYKSMGKEDKAIECFETVIASNPSDVLAYNHLASIYAQKEDYNKAIGIYKKGLQVDPNHPILQYNLAKAYQAVHDDAGAVAAFETALRAKPGWIDAIKDYAEVLLNHRKTRAAAELLKNSVELHSDNAELYALQGKILMNQCNFDEAVNSLECADKLKPKDSEILQMLAKAYIRRGKKNEAVSSIIDAERYSTGKNNISVMKGVIDILISAGKYEQALGCLKKASAERHNDVGLIDLAGQYYITQKKEDSVKLCLEKIRHFDSSYEEYMSNWAGRYHEIGNNEKSRELYIKYLDSNKKNSAVWVLLGQVDEEMGSNDSALDEYSTALAFDPANYAAKNLLKKLEEKVRVIAEENAETDEDFDLGDYIEKDSEEALEDTLMLGVEEPEMEDVDIFEFDDSVTPEEKESDDKEQKEPDGGAGEVAEGTVQEPAPECLVDDVPAESMLDYTDDATSLTDELVEDRRTDEASEGIEEENSPSTEEVDEAAYSDETINKKTEGRYSPDKDILSGLMDEPVKSYETEKISGSPADILRDDFSDSGKSSENNTVLSAEDVSKVAGAAADIARTVTAAQNYMQSAEDAVQKAAGKAVQKAAEDAVQKAAEDAVQKAAETAEKKLNGIVEDIQHTADSLKVRLDEFDNKHENFSSKEFERKPENSAGSVSGISSDAEKSSGTDDGSANCRMLLNHVRKFLPLIEKMLVNKEDAVKFKKEVLLFRQLRNMGEMLPENQRQEFLLGKTRLLLDFLIARLSGKPGLLKMSSSLRKSGALDCAIDFDVEDSEVIAAVSDMPVESLTREVLENMCVLAKDLPDRTMSQGLIKLAEEAGREIM